MKKFIKWNYRYAALAGFGLIIALIIYLFGYQHIAGYFLAATAALQLIPLALGMIETLKEGKVGIDLLAVVAILSSLIAHEYLTAGIIVMMLTGGEALEDWGESRAKKELNHLISNAPTIAHVVKNGKTSNVIVANVATGSTIVIRPGEVVPIDAEILEGESSFDESALTGEPLPIDKQPGEKIMSGSINSSGKITALTLCPASESQYEQIIKMVRDATNEQSPYVKMADRYSVVFTMIAFVIAGGAWALSGEFIRFVAVLVVATPCPLLLAAPIALVSGMSRSAKAGIMVKNGAAIEQFSKVKTVVFDKTGTLTYGKPTVADVKTSHGFKKNEILAITSAMEADSNHVLAQTIVEYGKKNNTAKVSVTSLHELPGFGIEAKYKGKQVLLGKDKLMHKNDIAIPKNLRADSTAAYVAIDGKIAGVIEFTDEIRENSQATISALKRLGIKNFLMLTGDNQTAAKAIAKLVGIKQVDANLLPNEKLVILKNIDEAHKPVAFVGDGVNDAPSLAAADVGVALGARGATAASESADIVIMLDDISKVAVGLAIAQRTFVVARQSILTGIAISIGLMFIFSTGRFQPVYGAVLQEVVDVIVIFNALRAHYGGKKAEF